MCGLPSITIMGNMADWELILQSVDKLTTFGQEPTKFCELLKPVILLFMRSFEDPTSAEVIDLWQRVVKHQSQGSGASGYSGWLTAFCFRDEEGKLMYELEISRQAR